MRSPSWLRDGFLVITVSLVVEIGCNPSLLRPPRHFPDSSGKGHRHFKKNNQTKINEKSKSKTRDTASIITPISWKNCCKNGGTCYLGSFCACPKNTYGRYCEFSMGTSPCGRLKHGQPIRQDCNHCLCVDGIISCLSGVYRHCKSTQFKEVKSYNFSVQSDVAEFYKIFIIGYNNGTTVNNIFASWIVATHLAIQIAIYFNR